MGKSYNAGGGAGIDVLATRPVDLNVSISPRPRLAETTLVGAA